MARRKDIFQRMAEYLETDEQREQRRQLEEARKERRLRRNLARVGLTQEQFDENVREFVRKFSS